MKRVVVTGMGALTPMGNDLPELWNNVVNGNSGAGPITRFNTEHFKTKFACEVKNFDPKIHLDRNEIKRTDLFTQYGLYAATEAMQDSGLDISTMSPFDVGVIWGCGQGGMSVIESEVKGFLEGNMIPRFSPFFVPKLLTNMVAGMISMKFGLMGINSTAVSACASANSAMMDAFNYIRLGKAKAFVTGGSESGITEASIGGFNSMKALSTRNDDPAAASRPFDTQRDGFVMGEGAGALIFEEYEHAKARGAKIYAEVIGAAMTADAHHISSPHPEGLGATGAMNLALAEAKESAENVSYLNAHATSTPTGDVSEIKAIENVFKGKYDNLKISATKSMTGHLLGAAGAVEGIICVKAVQENIIPPTTNVEELDPEIPSNIPLVLGEAIDYQVNLALSNTFGFGGHNAIVAFKKT